MTQVMQAMPKADPKLPHQEYAGRALNGIKAIVVFVLAYAVSAGLVGLSFGLGSDGEPNLVVFLIGIKVLVLASAALAGFFTLEPNQAAVLLLFGAYRGTILSDGVHYTNPFYRRRKVSLRVRNFDTGRSNLNEYDKGPSKVNDANGNPIEIAAVIVWKVVDTAKAMFQVDDLEHFVEVQSETAVRHMARSYPYDNFDDEEVTTLIGDSEEVSLTLTTELAERLEVAGVAVIEARLTDLSYAPEIAEAMLRRQQAAAIVAARKLIVVGAVAMVRDAIQQLESGDEDEAITLDSDRRATFASNLMTVIASDHPTAPVVNVGTLAR